MNEIVNSTPMITCVDDHHKPVIFLTAVKDGEKTLPELGVSTIEDISQKLKLEMESYVRISVLPEDLQLKIRKYLNGVVKQDV